MAIQKHYLFWSLAILLVLIGCKSETTNINGHWHIEYPNTEILDRFHETIDIQDSIGFINKTIDAPFTPNCRINNKQILYEDFGRWIPGTLTFEISKGTLKLHSSVYQEKLIGVLNDNCVRIEDHFLASPVDIDLYENLIDSLGSIQQRALHFSIYIGPVKEENSKGNIRYSYNKQGLHTLDQLEEYLNRHKSKIPKPLQPRIQYDIYLDKSVDVKYLRDLAKNMAKLNLSKINVILKQKSQSEYTLGAKRIDIADLKSISSVQELFD